jgi:hypothetical protein
MQLGNPRQQRTVAEILASLPDSDWTQLAQRLARLDRALSARHKADADLADALIRILKSPIGKKLRQAIANITKEETK